jgi:GH15 family glucan-1,4-alpha-glucosidase
MYPYGLVGNCQISALVSDAGSVDWLCLPRPDSPPVFGRLLDPEGGHFSITLEGALPTEGAQHYIENTNVLVTELAASNGDRVRITDFCPRFERHGRMARPGVLMRKLEPVRGSPLITVECCPVDGWGRNPVALVRSSNHVRGEIRGEVLRITTGMPITHLVERRNFVLKEPTYFALTWGAPVDEDLADWVESSLARTLGYWRAWVKHCSIPTLYQSEVIRSALALKLQCFEDTGAILAAPTTSLPEERAGTRNWDYRYCWLRDAHFTLGAFHALGHFDEMEGFLRYLIGIAERHEAARHRLAPVYTLSQELPLPEHEHPRWRGYSGAVPVRTGNQAAEHVQNDVYGEMLLTLAPIFLDQRFVHLRNREHEALLGQLADLCDRSLLEPDAGLWEVRNHWQPHTFTRLMAWAGLDRTAAIRGDSASRLRADRALAAVLEGLREGVLWNGPEDPTLDSALSLAAVLRLPDRSAAGLTLQAIRSDLALGRERPLSSFYYRYLRPDDFGRPRSAFLVCSFWVAQALASLGLRVEAREVLDDALRAANRLGLFSEHFDPSKGLQLGNFPQAYSHVGLINAAFAVSPPWSDVL